MLPTLGDRRVSRRTSRSHLAHGSDASLCFRLAPHWGDCRPGARKPGGAAALPPRRHLAERRGNCSGRGRPTRGAGGAGPGPVAWAGVGGPVPASCSRDTAVPPPRDPLRPSVTTPTFASHPPTLATTNLFPISIVSSFQQCHVSGIIQQITVETHFFARHVSLEFIHAVRIYRSFLPVARVFYGAAVRLIVRLLRVICVAPVFGYYK